MYINDRIINADCLDIINELQSQLHLNNINLINKITNTPDNVMITCPYHKNGQESRPSAGIRKDDGTFHCFTCGETHTLPEVISYCFGYNDILGKQGMKWLSKNFNYTEVENRNVKCNINRNNALCRDTNTVSDIGNTNGFVREEELDKYRYYHSYWTKRGITDERIIELFDLGYDKETDCITFPVRDKDGNCLFVARRSVKTKYFNYPSGTQKPLYGLYEICQLDVKKFPKEIFVCESMIDCILLWQSGKIAVALNGLGSKSQLKWLKCFPCRKLILATDNDDAGRKARDRIKKSIKNKIITEIQFPKDIKDIGECSREQIDNIKEWEVL